MQSRPQINQETKLTKAQIRKAKKLRPLCERVDDVIEKREEKVLKMKLS